MAFKVQTESRVRKAVNMLMEGLQARFRKKLEEQGHVLTKELWESVDFETKRIANGIESTMYANDYGVYLDRGIKPEDIPFSPGSGAGKSKYIEGLIRFFTLKGLGPQEATRAAFATAHKHKREGFPIDKSRVGWIRNTLKESDQWMERTMEMALDEAVDIAFEAFDEELSRIFSNR